MFLFTLAAIGALLGGVVLVLSVVLSSGAPQQAAGAAIAVALAVIPYVLARANAESRRMKFEERVKEQLDRMADALVEIEKRSKSGG